MLANADHRKSPRDLNPEELNLLAAIYISQLDGGKKILTNVKKTYERLVVDKPTCRKNISTRVIARHRNLLGWEDTRLRALEKTREELLHRTVTGRMSDMDRALVIEDEIIDRLLNYIDMKGEKILPSFGDYDKIIRLKSFIRGGPDSRPDNGPTVIAYIPENGRDSETALENHPPPEVAK